MKDHVQAKELFDLFLKIRKLIKSESTTLNLNLTDLIVFGILINVHVNNNGKQIQAKDLSDKMNISRPALNNILNRLENQGLITRIRGKKDRRKVFLEMSEKACLLYENEHAILMDILSRYISKMGDEDAKEFNRLLNKFYNIMKEETGYICCN